MNMFFTDTAERTWLRVHGDDASTFLQGQFSNDLRKLTPQTAQLSSYSSAKGRMLAVLFLVRSGDDILIEVPRSIADATVARLKMFVLRAKLTIEIANEIDALAIFGNDAQKVMSQHELPTPDAALQCAEGARGLSIVRRLGGPTRYSVIGPREQIAALRTTLGDALRKDESSHWRRADIESGIPVVLPETRDHFVAQMANLDLFDGISFDKGCYTGQEIIARLHYLGTLKRRMFIARIEGIAPAPGTTVHQTGDSQAVGEIVDAVTDGDAALATVVLQLAARNAELTTADSAARITILTGPSA